MFQKLSFIRNKFQMCNVVNIFFGDKSYVFFDDLQGLHVVDVHTGDNIVQQMVDLMKLIELETAVNVIKQGFFTEFCLLYNYLLSQSACACLFFLLWQFSDLDCYMHTFLKVHNRPFWLFILEVHVRIVIDLFVDFVNTNLFAFQLFNLSWSFIKVAQSGMVSEGLILRATSQLWRLYLFLDFSPHDESFLFWPFHAITLIQQSKISIIIQMNRVVFHVLQENTSVSYEQLKLLESPKPIQIAFQSQNFPIYPISINTYLQNPPFNRIALVFVNKFCPQKIALYGSENGLEYVKFKQLSNLSDRQQQIIHIFQKKIFIPYVKLALSAPLKSKENPCSQIKMRGMQFTMVSFFQSRFVCSLKSQLTYHPVLFRLLEVIQYKYLILKKDGNRLSDKYEKRLDQIVKMIDSKKVDTVSPPQQMVVKWKVQVAYLESEPIHYDNFVELPDPVQTKKDIYKLQKQLQGFFVDRLAHVKPHVKHYFQKYQQTQIRENYLRQLSSNEREDHNKALVNFWNEVKKLQQYTPQTQQAILMFFNFYLQFLDSDLKISAIKILILFNKNNPNPKNHNLTGIYDRILHNVVKHIHSKENEDFFELCLKYCYLLFDRLDNEAFIRQLLNAFKSYSLAEKIQKLQILEKLTFRGVVITDRSQIIDFLIDVLSHKEITLTEKNRAYNVAAYLASIYGKETVMKDFEKLNSMILMTMQKNIDNKVGKIKRPKQQEESSYNCQFCGTYNNSFKDQNLYDLHLAKQCKFITNCRFCSQNVEIPELFKHYIEQCTNKHEFKHCENCFEVIQTKDQEEHNKSCTRKLQTKCPLCYQKVSSKLKLKQHLLTQGCPNNSR